MLTGRDFRKFRRYYELTLKEVANETGVHFTSISKFERNKTNMNYIDVIHLEEYKNKYESEHARDEHDDYYI